jgi:hypothetical protein
MSLRNLGAPRWFAMIFAVYYLAGAADCRFRANGDDAIGCVLLDGPLYYLMRCFGVESSSLPPASATRWLLWVALGAVMYALAGAILGFLARFALRLLRGELRWRDD